MLRRSHLTRAAWTIQPSLGRLLACGPLPRSACNLRYLLTKRPLSVILVDLLVDHLPNGKWRNMRLISATLCMSALLPGCVRDWSFPGREAEGSTNGTNERSTKSELALLVPVFDASVQIHALNELGEGVSRGSGVVVADRVVLTAGHMLDGAHGFRVLLGSQNTLARVARRGNGSDWAILVLERSLGKAIPIHPAGRSGTLALQKAVAVGYSLGLPYPTVTYGHLQPSESGMLRMSSPIVPGNSGGGLYIESEGKLKLVGITVAVFLVRGLPAFHMGISVPISAITGLER